MSQDEGRQSSPILVSLIPNLMAGEGHIIPYHQSVSQAVHQLKWQHRIVIPVDSQIKELPINWEPVLCNYDLEKEGNFFDKLLRLQGTWKLSQSIANYLRAKVINQADFSIIFLERFIHLQLFALLIALYLVPTDKLSVWLLYRRDTYKDRTRFVYKLLNYLIKKRLRLNRLKLLTDSELLGKGLFHYFQEPVKIVPIPHTDINHCAKIISRDSQIVCWWPGFPREEKGLEIIKNLVNKPGDYATNITIVCAKCSQLNPTENGVNLKLIKNHLTREEYQNWLQLSTIILLPYNAPAYQARTSGIFTESIMAGKIPLVTHDTWMAHELFKYNLAELVIDWHKPKKVFELIENLANDDEIRAKLQAMKQSYEKFHSIGSYAGIIETLYREMTC